jgi:hypothetical protein
MAKGRDLAQTPPGVASEIQGSLSGGRPLPQEVRRFMEPRFRADFAKVRIHADARSERLSSQLNAKAFTIGNHIFFGRGLFQPESNEGLELLAHELTHTIQQGSVIQRSEAPQVTQRSEPMVQRSILDEARDFAADKANFIPGFRMFTVVLGVNPINGQTVERSAANILRAIVEFLPGGAAITSILETHGIFDRVGAWLEQQLRVFGNLAADIGKAFKDFVESLGLGDVFDLGGVWDRAKSIFTKPIDGIINFVKGTVTGILGFIKDAVLMPLAKLAQGTRGYDLLRALLGRDPISGEAVPRTADNLIGGFMKLIGEKEIWENIKKGNAINRAWAWFQGALAEVKGIAQAIPGRISNTLSSLTILDFVTVVGVLAKIAGTFGGIAIDFVSWGGRQVFKLLEILVSVVAPNVLQYIAKAKSAFHTILRNPVAFVGNLVRAGRRGFQLFADNILTHLKTALIKWIVGPLAEAGVYIPKSFDLHEVIKLVLSVLGLTWQNIRSKLVKIIPDPVLAALEKTADVLVTLVRDGPAAAWEQIKAELTELKDQLIGQVTNMISTEIVKAAVTKIATMINPAGAVIQAIVATYKTVTFFIEKIQQIAAVVASFIDSIAAIAAGQVEPAAKKVEQTMANTLVVVLAFLAKLIGLGAVPDKLAAIIKKIRQPIDKGLDKIVAWLGKMLDKVAAGVRKGVQAVSNWWKRRVSFTSRDGKSHSVYVERAGQRYDLTVASKPERVVSKVNALLKGEPTLEKSKKTTAEKILEAETRARAHSNFIASETEAGRGQAPETVQRANDLQGEMRNIATWFVELFPAEPAGDDELPQPIYTYTMDAGRAKVAQVQFLSANRPAGSKPAASPAGWSEIRDQGLTTKGQRFVQMHLINERLGGLGMANNLVPGSKANNDTHHDQVEKHIKDLVGHNPRAANAIKDRKVVHYKLTVIYREDTKDSVYNPTGRAFAPVGGRKPPDPTFFARGITCDWGEYTENKEKPAKDPMRWTEKPGKSISFPIEIPNLKLI